jgi:hypothetical protein
MTSKKNPRFTRSKALDEKQACLSGCVKRTVQSQIIVELARPQAFLQAWPFPKHPKCFRSFNLFEILKPFTRKNFLSNQ